MLYSAFIILNSHHHSSPAIKCQLFTIHHPSSVISFLPPCVKLDSSFPLYAPFPLTPLLYSPPSLPSFTNSLLLYYPTSSLLLSQSQDWSKGMFSVGFCIVDKANVQKQCRLINYQCRNGCSLSRTQLTIDSCIASYPCMQSWPASNVSRETSRE